MTRGTTPSGKIRGHMLLVAHTTQCTAHLPSQLHTVPFRPGTSLQLTTVCNTISNRTRRAVQSWPYKIRHTVLVIAADARVPCTWVSKTKVPEATFAKLHDSEGRCWAASLT